MKFLKTTIITSALVLSTSVNAAFIDFEESPNDFNLYGASHTSQGFLFEGWKSGTSGTTGSIRVTSQMTGNKGIINSWGNGMIRMQQTNGETFNVQSLDVGASTIKNVTFTGVFSDGLTISQTVSTLGNSYEFFHATFSGFQNLVSLQWNRESNLVDNISVSTSAVPIPAAVWLFGSGLIGLIGVARKKSRI